MRGIKLTRLYYYYYCTTSCFFFSSSPFVCVYDFSLTRLLSLSLLVSYFFFSFLSPYFSTDFSLSFVSLSLSIRNNKILEVQTCVSHMYASRFRRIRIRIFSVSLSFSFSIYLSSHEYTHSFSNCVYFFFYFVAKHEASSCVAYQSTCNNTYIIIYYIIYSYLYIRIYTYQIQITFIYIYTSLKSMYISPCIYLIFFSVQSPDKYFLLNDS